MNDTPDDFVSDANALRIGRRVLEYRRLPADTFIVVPKTRGSVMSGLYAGPFLTILLAAAVPTDTQEPAKDIQVTQPMNSQVTHPASANPYTMVIYHAKDGWRWKLESANYLLVAESGEAYSSKWNCKRAVRKLLSSAIVLK